MKLNVSFLLIIAILISFNIACNKEKDQQSSLSPYGTLTKHSGCVDKKNLSAAPSNISRVEYSYDKEKQLLLVKHINAGFNCCYDKLYSNIEFTEETITIEELEDSRSCKCNCLFNLNFELKNIEAQKYTLKFVEPYANESIIFEIDLTKQQSGFHEVVRTYYPWSK